MPDQTTSKTDPRTGVVVKYAPPLEELRPPDSKIISDISKVAGANPSVVNLRDNNSFAGMELLTTEREDLVAFGEGDQGGKKSNYVMVTCWVYAPGTKPGKAILLRTGAGNVYNRIAEAYVKGALPVRGTLRKSGRAWFLD